MDKGVMAARTQKGIGRAVTAGLSLAEKLGLDEAVVTELTKTHREPGIRTLYGVQGLAGLLEALDARVTKAGNLRKQKPAEEGD